MFINDELNNHLQSSSTIKSQSAILAEWNMNFLDNISAIGNYRYRKTAGLLSKYSTLPNTYDVADNGKFYTDATYSDIVVDGGFDTSNQPVYFTSKKEKENLLFSLEDCFGRFRPRSGINKIRYGITKFIHHSNSDMFKRPRYYMADKNDKFKYWTSYRTESNVEYGISNQATNGKYYIDDAVPYVVYKDAIPANRVVIKMQTNVGEVDLGPFSNSRGLVSDPLYGAANQTTPSIWKIQYLENNNWVDAISFNETSKRLDGTQVIGYDGYVEIAYGMIIPDEYVGRFNYNGQHSSSIFLPDTNTDGQAYLIKQNSNETGTYYIWSNGKYNTFTPKFGWYLQENGVDRHTSVVTSLSNAPSHIDSSDGIEKFDEFVYLSGLRIVVETMNKSGAVFDLIELSPRLIADISDQTKSFSIKKQASDLGVSGLPVGQLLASTGNLELFDYNQSFNDQNNYDAKTNPSGSIVSKYMNKNLQIKFYEAIIDVNGKDYYVPIKTMYAEGFPTISNKDRSVSIVLRDMYFYFESMAAPETLIQDVSLSYAIALLFDSIGFSNYIYKRIDGEPDPIIPFFFVGPKQSVAEVLQQLAVSTQSAMFFDEYNNFVVMSKNYIMPSESDRATDMVLSGSQDSISSGAVRNKSNGSIISNIIDVSSQDNNVYNDGKISYTTRYIQKSYGTIKQAYLLDKEKRWIYKPAMLWEVSGTGNTKSVNDEVGNQSKYNLSAIPLSSTLSAKVPTVLGGQVIDNIIDLGQAIYWMPRYAGYFYANGEIIRFDAVEYNVGSVGNVWISSLLDYQKYFSKISFNGKIYPTGRVRIYAEPNSDVINGITILRDGAVAKHGRGQFGTPVVEHSAGIRDYWTSNDNVRGVTMNSDYLFNPGPAYPALTKGINGTDADNQLATKTKRTGLIKNFLSYSYAQESDIITTKTPDSQTVQASALTMEGPTFAATDSPQNFISYVFKPLDIATSATKTTAYKHFGTRMRVVGKIQNNADSIQSASGSSSLYTVTQKDASGNIYISGGGGGIAVMVNPDTNEGYYLEITALSENNIDKYTDSTKIKNVTFYKLMKSSASGNTPIPVLLKQAGTDTYWPGGLAQILVDTGKFTGQSRVVAEEKNTVYDISVEYKQVGSIRRFYIYLNNNQIATLDDTDPLPIYNNIGLFVRGSSKVMFENVFALANNYSESSVTTLDGVASSAFGASGITTNESFRKYAVSGIVQSTYLSGISATGPSKHTLYYEEFGTIMREAAYMNVKYDKAYPALYTKIAPTFNSIRGYTVSGYFGGPYGAEFLIFNNTDMSLNLDETSGNYLRILGITFTQASQTDLTVDEYFSKKSDFSTQLIKDDATIVSDDPTKLKKDFYDIKISRMTYGKKEFSLETPYIQSQDAANDMMAWIISKVMKPRKSVGLNIFANPTIQLGDIVTIDYDKDGLAQISENGSRFVVYSIDYQKEVQGPSMTIYLSEVA